MKFLDKVRQIIKSNRSSRPYTDTKAESSVIMGWVNFHRHHACRKDFKKVEAQIFRAIWNWAKRRHSKKGKRWICRKYFTTCGKRSWIFFGDSPTGERIHLYLAGNTKAQMYERIRTDVNPYDPAWKEYLAKREARRQASRKQKRQLRTGEFQPDE